MSEPKSGGRPASYLFVLLWDTHHVSGVTAVVRNLVQQMERLGPWAPTIVVNDWLTPAAHADGIEWRFRFAFLGRPSMPALLLSTFRAPWRLFRTWSFLRARRAAVVNFHYLSADALGVAILKRLGLFRGQLVISLHGTDVRRPADRVECAARKVIFAAADKVVAVSHGLAQRAVSDLELDPDRISVVYNGVNHLLFNPEASQLASDVEVPAGPFIVSVGLYIPRKDHVTLLDAFIRVADRYPSLHLCFIGGDGPEREPLLQRARVAGLQDRVRALVGLSPEQVARLVARASLCVQPALAEGLPLAVLEAAAAGVPLALSSIPGHDELVEPGVNGLLFPPRDVEACSFVISRLLDDPAAASTMAVAQRAISLASFTWDACYRGYLRELGQLQTMADSTDG